MFSAVSVQKSLFALFLPGESDEVFHLSLSLLSLHCLDVVCGAEQLLTRLLLQYFISLCCSHQCLHRLQGVIFSLTLKLWCVCVSECVRVCVCVG